LQVLKEEKRFLKRCIQALGGPEKVKKTSRKKLLTWIRTRIELKQKYPHQAWGQIIDSCIVELIKYDNTEIDQDTMEKINRCI